MKLLPFLFAPLLVLACSSDDEGCPSDGECSSSVTGKLALNISAQELGTASIRACRKPAGLDSRACSTGTSGTVPTSTETITFVLNGSVPSTAYLSKNGTSYVIRVTFAIESQNPVNGDEYAIELIAPDGSPIDSLTKVVTYASVYPNGQGCLPTCSSAEFAE